MGSFEGEVGYVWLELTIDGKDYLVGGHSFASEKELDKLIINARTDHELYTALTAVVDEYLSAEIDRAPFVSDEDDGVWVIDFDEAGREPIPLKQADIKRAFFEYVCCDETWCDSYNFATGLSHDAGDMEDHPQSRLHGNDVGWLMEYCSD